jgi:hypothetical protein
MTHSSAARKKSDDLAENLSRRYSKMRIVNTDESFVCLRAFERFSADAAARASATFLHINQRQRTLSDPTLLIFGTDH